MPPIADKIDLGERFMVLDIVMLIPREPSEWFANGDRPKELDPRQKQAPSNIDWDPVLRNLNRWCDRVATGMRVKDRVSRKKQMRLIWDELEAIEKKLGESVNLAEVLRPQTPPVARGKILADISISMIVPAFFNAQPSADRAEQVQHNLQLAFALGAYQRDHGRYPKQLSDLAPKYLAQIPKDVFSNKALIYRPSRNGYLLYSVGVNGRDDGGRWYSDDPPGDDRYVLIPLPALR